MVSVQHCGGNVTLVITILYISVISNRSSANVNLEQNTVNYNNSYNIHPKYIIDDINTICTVLVIFIGYKYISRYSMYVCTVLSC
jgi:hypothetical protein